jgi:hypothetical protein
MPSPIPEKLSQAGMSFDEALSFVLEGRKITRLSWQDPETYGLLNGETLSIMIQGKLNNWIVVVGDIEANDWVIV